MMYCEKCGHEIIEGWKVCQYCGTRIESDDMSKSQTQAKGGVANTAQKQAGAQTPKKKKKKWSGLVAAVAALVVAVFVIAALENGDVTENAGVTDKSDVTDESAVGLGELTGNIEGTYVEAGGDYYGASGDEFVKIEKNGKDSFNVYLYKYYNNLEMNGYKVTAIAEEVPVGEFSKNTYVILLGESNVDSYYISFEDSEKLDVEGHLYVFEKKDMEIDLTEAVADFKTLYSYMDYKYSSYSSNVDIIYWENAFGVDEPISFHKKWYEQFNTFKGIGSLKIQKGDGDRVDILLDDNVYCSFCENEYVIGESYNWVTYKCEDGTEFEFYPSYEGYQTHDVRPMIHFHELKEEFITDAIRENYSDYSIKYETYYLYSEENSLEPETANAEAAGAGGAFQNDRILDAEEAKDWYLTYNQFLYENDSNGMWLEVSCQNDVYLDISFRNGLQTYDSDGTGAEPDAIGNEGELIYKFDGMTMTYYPYDHHINIDTPDGLYKGNYYPAEMSLTEEYATDFILPHSDSKFYSEGDIAGLNAEQCRIARNEIYARHGRIFQSEDLQNYFAQFAWYEGKYTAEQFDESVLNQCEKWNIQLIKDYEAKMGY